jgi:hypothetical protein
LSRRGTAKPRLLAETGGGGEHARVREVLAVLVQVAEPHLSAGVDDELSGGSPRVVDRSPAGFATAGLEPGAYSSRSTGQCPMPNASYAAPSGSTRMGAGTSYCSR